MAAFAMVFFTQGLRFLEVIHEGIGMGDYVYGVTKAEARGGA